MVGPSSRRDAPPRARGAIPGDTARAAHSVVAIREQPLMARPSSGQITESRWKDGRTVTFGARLYAYGRRQRLVFGTNSQGWNQTRAQIELEAVLQQVARGTWLPPDAQFRPLNGPTASFDAPAVSEAQRLEEPTSALLQDIS